MQVQKDDLNTPLITTIGIVSAVLLFVIIVVLQAWFAQAQREEFRRKVVDVRATEAADAWAEQEGRLAGYRWVDRERGVVAIPIERAMELVAREHGAAAPSSGEAQ